MRLTVLTDYALRVLMYAGLHTDRLCTIGEIAQAHGISHAHLVKVTHLLGRLGYLETVRGKGGGMRLARPAENIVLGTVIRALEPDFDLVHCFSQPEACRLSVQCRLSGVLREALAAFLEVFDRYSLADLLAGNAPRPAGTAPIPAPS